MEGRKFDLGKTRFDLLDPEFIKAMAEIMTMGAEKYSPNNWQHVEGFEERYLSALHRHLNAWQIGEYRDEESQITHMAHVAINAMFLAWSEYEKYKDVSRRPSNPDKGYLRPGETDPVSDEIDDDKRDQGDGPCKPEEPEVPGRRGTHEYPRTRDLNALIGGSKS